MVDKEEIKKAFTNGEINHRTLFGKFIIICIVSLFIFLGFVMKDKVDQAFKNSEGEYYISCGCGCCSFDKQIEEIAKEFCLYRSKGESIQQKIEKDKNLSEDFCAVAGCGFPIKYKYCN